MKKMLIVAISLVLGTSAVASQHQSNKEAEVFLSPYLGCYARAEVDERLLDGEFVALIKSNGPDGRVNEVWINDRGYTTTIAYKNPEYSANENVCVTNVTKSSSYNTKVINTINFK